MIREIGERGKESRRLHRFIAALLHQRQGQVQRGARDAIANRIDLLLIRDGLHFFDRTQIAILDIILHTDLGMAWVRVQPADNKDGIALIHDPFDQAVLLFQIENVVFVDPRRENHQRDFMHLIGAW